MKARRANCRGGVDGAGRSPGRVAGPTRGRLARALSATSRLIAAAGRLGSDRRGSIIVLAAASFTLLVIATAMALDMAQLYIAKSTAQRIADQSAMAAALAYGQGKDSTSIMQNTAGSLSNVNGITAANVSAAIVASPRNDGNNAAMVTVTAQVPLVPFAKAAFGLSTMAVSATAYAELQDAGACFTALKSGGVTGTGGVTLTTSGCAVVSAGSITATNGATYTAKAFDSVGSITTSNGGSITTTPTSGNLLTGSSKPLDPYNTDGNYNGIFASLANVYNLTAPTHSYTTSAPSGQNYTCASGVLNLGSGSNTYGTITLSGTCSVVIISGGSGTTTNISYLSTSNFSGTIIFGDGTYNIGGVYIGGTGTVTIDDSASTAVINVWNGYNTQSGSSASVVFNGPATYSITGGINAYGSGSITFANVFSSANSTFYVSGGINATHGSLTFPNGYYTITSGGINDASNNITFGNGSFIIAGGIQYSGGSGSVTFGSALDSNSVFQVPTSTNGYAIDTSGSSSLTIGSFTEVDLNGNVTIAGNLTLGAGTYLIYGDFDANATGGGSISANSVSIIVEGAISFGQGYSSITITAPSTLTSSTLGTGSTIALASISSAASTVTAGASNTVIQGAVYLPNAAITFAGSGTITGNGGCTMMVMGSANFSGGGSFSTSCNGVANVTTAGASLVQ